MSGLVYQCRSCGSLVNLLVLGGGDLTCCGMPLQPLEPDRSDGSREEQPPLDLLQVIIDGKAVWAISDAGGCSRVGEEMQAWEVASNGSRAFDFFASVRG